MLWESVDPAETLLARFGFADSARAVAWLGDALSGAWAIPVDDCDRLVISAGNLLAWITSGGGRFIAKCSVDPALFPRLADAAALAAWLDAHGIPVAVPVAASDGRLRIELNNVSLGVLPVVDGDLLDVEDPVQVNEAGRMLASLHEVLAAYPYLIDSARPTRSGQLVHNDFRSANILHDGMAITAVLDFEEVTYRARVADLAKAAVLLGTRYHDWAPTSPGIREKFVAAYRDRSPLTSAEESQLQHGINAVLGHFGWA